MCAIVLALVSVISACPKEYQLDCSGWKGFAPAEFQVRIEAEDGAVFKTDVVLEKDSTPEQACNTLQGAIILKGEFRGRVTGENILVLEGAKKSAIRSVKVTSQVWKPDLRVQLVVPKK